MMDWIIEKGQAKDPVLDLTSQDHRKHNKGTRILTGSPETVMIEQTVEKGQPQNLTFTKIKL